MDARLEECVCRNNREHSLAGRPFEEAPHNSGDVLTQVGEDYFLCSVLLVIHSGQSNISKVLLNIKHI